MCVCWRLIFFWTIALYHTRLYETKLCKWPQHFMVSWLIWFYYVNWNDEIGKVLRIGSYTWCWKVFGLGNIWKEICIDQKMKYKHNIWLWNPFGLGEWTSVCGAQKTSTSTSRFIKSIKFRVDFSFCLLSIVRHLPIKQNVLH